MDCIFCKITKKEIPSDFVFENERIMVIRDIKPSAPIHLLVIPKLKDYHINSVNDVREEDGALVAEMFLVAKEMAKKQGLDTSGYKLVFNVGRGGGQIIDHLHLHLLGGWSEKNTRHLP